MTFPYFHKILNHSIIVVFALLVFSFSAFAQEVNSGGISIHVDKELERSKQNNILSTVVKVVNVGSDVFEGQLRVDAPEGLRSIAGEMVRVSVAGGDSTFVPIRFLVNRGIASGNNKIAFALVDGQGDVADEAFSLFAVEERIDLSLAVENKHMMITNVADSVHVSATVSNNGNKGQEVIVVFSIPRLKRGVNFVEQKAYLEPQERRRFVMAFVPQRELLSQYQFQVKIAAMHGREKNLFGNGSVDIQNVSNNRVFEDPTSHYGLTGGYDRNSISASYRATTHGSGIAQLNGSVDVDLLAGYLNLKGNLYKYDTNDKPMATNTSLSYLLGNNEYLVGNVYESLETSVSGRGAKVRLGQQFGSNLVVGVVDQEYDLFSKRGLFEDNYSAFVKGEKVIYGRKLQKVQGSAVYKRDSREQSHDVISGGELGWRWANKWQASVRLHGALSHLMTDGSNHPSGSAEVRYNGEGGGFNLSGNYYYSSPYFPGNRRGVLSLQQGVSRKLGEFSVNGNAYYSSFKPRSHVMPINTNTGNLMANGDLYFPRWVNVTFGVGYQHQYETSNGYRQNQDSEMEMRANRFRGSMSWSSRKIGHSASVTTELGRSTNSISDNASSQYKVGLSYSLKWFTVSSQYQRGSYYISEQLSSSNSNRPYERFLSSLSVNQQLFDNKLSVMANVGVSKDYYSDFSPSSYINVRYGMSKWFSMFVNSNWYSYKYKNAPAVNTFSNELGLTVHLQGRRANTTKKSRVKAFLYHDHNSNGVYDAGDEPAKGYSVSINKRPFITNDKGEVTYRKVPFGKYEVGQISDRGWFGDADTLYVDKFKTNKQIALQQAGVVTGSIRYSFDSRTSMEIDPKIEGIIFQINSTDGVIKHRVSTNDDATFTVFLPKGEYRVELVASSLPANTSCHESMQTVEVVSGKIVKLSPFVIEVHKKKVNIRRFGD